MKTVFKQLALEMAFWYVPSFIFLAIYIGQYYNPYRVIFDHLYPISLIVASVFLLKVCLHQFSLKPNFIRSLVALLYSTVWLSILTYYLLVIIGLRSWGQVITEELITSYAGQLPQLFEALGTPFIIPVVLSVLILILASFCAYFFNSKFFTPSPKNNRCSKGQCLWIRSCSHSPRVKKIRGKFFCRSLY